MGLEPAIENKINRTRKLCATNYANADF